MANQRRAECRNVSDTCRSAGETRCRVPGRVVADTESRWRMHPRCLRQGLFVVSELRQE